MERKDLEAGVTVRRRDFTTAGVVIIGGGFSGMCMAIKLLEKGIRDLVILEKSSGFGGTWKDNAYPGCCCDIFSRLYSFSFEQNPDWSRLYPEQAEILTYMRNVARKYDLYRFARFSSEVVAATWDEEARQWKVDVRVLAGKEAEACETYTIKTAFVTAGMGQLNEPYLPVIPGIDSFQGKTMHSARWDWSYDFSGKRVCIIGNGATAVQIAPEISKVAKHLTIFQRTPNWIIPRDDEAVPAWQKTLFRHVPFLLRRLRAECMDGREASYEPLIQRESAASVAMVQLCKGFLRKQLPDRPDLWPALTPDYPPGCKRVLLSDDYYPMLRQAHVALETGTINRIDNGGIVVGSAEENRHIDCDVIVFATGFRTHDFLPGVKATGAGGRTLQDIWAGGASALYGITVESLPNFGLLYGPNTNLGHNSIILMIEAQASYLATIIQQAHRHPSLSVAPRPARLREWDEQLQKALAASSFADPRCQSWYKTADGRVTNNWSGTVVAYQKLLARVDWADYDIEGRQTPQGMLSIGRVIEETWVGTPTLLVGAAMATAVAAGGYLYRNRRRAL